MEGRESGRDRKLERLYAQERAAACAQFDVHEGRVGKELLLDCQSDLLDHFDTRLVVPLVPTQTAQTLPRLHPTFEIAGTPHIMATQLASAVGVEELGPTVASLADRRYDILNALDILITGF